MFKSIQAKNFKAVPYLETSLLATNHPEGIQFSLTKPNVIVGPNGAGKSALMTTLSLQTLSHLIGESSFDSHYINGRYSDAYWSETSKWSEDWEYLQGLTCDTDRGPALYYRPGQLPGNESTIAHAMVTGYFDLAKKHGELIKNKSAGQQSQAVLEKLYKVLRGEATLSGYKQVNWSYGTEPKKLNRARYSGSLEYKAEALKAKYASISPDATPVLLLDEPEQSLDAKAEAQLWRLIGKVNCSKVQVIVASHSFYPLMHPDEFNLIEAVPGYVEEVRSLI